MLKVVRQMEVWLGPDTADLSMKIGIHSGPVTGGVLRGEKSRFQLFGETMDNAFKMEETGLPGRIHISQATADLLRVAGHTDWANPSEQKIILKGKTETKSYWLKIRRDTKKVKPVKATLGGSIPEDHGTEDASFSSMDSDKLEAIENSNNKDKKRRLVDWNVDNLMRSLKLIVAMRGANKHVERSHVEASDNPLSEVKEIITLRSEVNDLMCDPSSVELPPVVEAQLADYVNVISDLYRGKLWSSKDQYTHVRFITNIR